MLAGNTETLNAVGEYPYGTSYFEEARSFASWLATQFQPFDLPHRKRSPTGPPHHPKPQVDPHKQEPLPPRRERPEGPPRGDGPTALSPDRLPVEMLSSRIRYECCINSEPSKSAASASSVGWIDSCLQHPRSSFVGRLFGVDLRLSQVWIGLPPLPPSFSCAHQPMPPLDLHGRGGSAGGHGQRQGSRRAPFLVPPRWIGTPRAQPEAGDGAAAGDLKWPKR